MKIRKAEERGTTRIGWLDSRHTFSFGEYIDRDHVGYRSLRVINDDRVAAGQGFGTHGHRDMEIITIVLEGQLEHKDSLGHGEVLNPGEVQVMSAGSGIRHSEFNPSQSAGVHFLQVWILPSGVGLPARYNQKPFPRSERLNRLQRVAGGGEVEDGALPIHQDAHLFLGALNAEGTISYEVTNERGVWIHIATGSVVVNDETLQAGDGASFDGPTTLEIQGTTSDAEILLFDLT